MSSILTPGQRPDAGTVLGDHQRRIQRLEAVDPFADCACVPLAGTTLSDLILAEPCLTAFWKLNEASGDVAADSGPGGFDLDSGDDLPPTWGQAAGPPGDLTAQFGSGISEQRASFSALTDDLTAEIWAYRDDTTQDDLIGQGDAPSANQDGWSLSIGAFNVGLGNRAIIYVGDSTGGPHTVSSDSAIDINTWYYLVLTRTSHIWRLYVNGAVQTATYDDSGTNFSSQSGVWIGRTTTSGASQFNGRASYAAVYSCALSAEDIAAHYLAPTSGASVTDGYVLTWLNDEAVWLPPTIEVEF